MDELVKIIMVYNRMLTICQNLEKGHPHGMPCKKRDMDECAPWMKRDSLYTSGVVGREIIHMGYVQLELYSISNV